jgi:hypothetical protein
MNVFHPIPGRIHVEPARSVQFDTPPAAPHPIDIHAFNRHATTRRENVPRTGRRTADDLPRAYIGTPKGDLRSDPRYMGIVVDESGKRYAQIGAHYYAVRNDSANGTWRAIQLQEPAKPGIPIRRDRAGNWQPHDDTGLRGGSPNDPRIEAERQALERSRNDYLDRIRGLSAQEHSVLALIESISAERQGAENLMRQMQPGAANAAEHERTLDQIKQRLSHAETTLRTARDALYIANGKVREIDRNLSLLPPRSK